VSEVTPVDESTFLLPEDAACDGDLHQRAERYARKIRPILSLGSTHLSISANAMCGDSPLDCGQSNRHFVPIEKLILVAAGSFYCWKLAVCDAFAPPRPQAILISPRSYT